MSARWKVVITDAEYADERIEAAVLSGVPGGVSLVRADCRDGSGLAKVAADADALLSQYCPLGPDALAALTRCRVIARYGVGYDTVDIPAATARGICVCNVPDYCVDEVSDHALALLLSWARRVTALDRSVRAGEWDHRAVGPVIRLRGRTLGLVGFGRMARALAAKARPLGLRVLAHDPLLPAKAIQAGGAEPAGTLQDLLSAADFVSVHVPLGEGTRALIGQSALRRMRSGAVLINTSRGAVVDEDALARALREGWIAGAALDVLATEPPPPGHPLVGLPNIILTPHVAWYSEESEAELRRKAAQNVAAVLCGRCPPYLVNPQAWVGP